jgi:hypothetical protein
MRVFRGYHHSIRQAESRNRRKRAVPGITYSLERMGKTAILRCQGNVPLDGDRYENSLVMEGLFMGCLRKPLGCRMLALRLLAIRTVSVVRSLKALLPKSLRMGTHGVVAASMGLHVVPSGLPLGIPKVPCRSGF